jgi:hypothetical protein
MVPVVPAVPIVPVVGKPKHEKIEDRGWKMVNGRDRLENTR